MSVVAHGPLVLKCHFKHSWNDNLRIATENSVRYWEAVNIAKQSWRHLGLCKQPYHLPYYILIIFLSSCCWDSFHICLNKISSYITCRVGHKNRPRVATNVKHLKPVIESYSQPYNGHPGKREPEKSGKDMIEENKKSRWIQFRSLEATCSARVEDGPYANVWNLKVFKIVEEQVK